MMNHLHPAKEKRRWGTLPSTNRNERKNPEIHFTVSQWRTKDITEMKPLLLGERDSADAPDRPRCAIHLLAADLTASCRAASPPAFFLLRLTDWTQEAAITGQFVRSKSTTHICSMSYKLLKFIWSFLFCVLTFPRVLLLPR